MNRFRGSRVDSTIVSEVGCIRSMGRRLCAVKISWPWAPFANSPSAGFTLAGNEHDQIDQQVEDGMRALLDVPVDGLEEALW